MPYDVTFAGDIERAWCGDAQPIINGESGVQLDDGEAGSRAQYHFAEQGLLMLVDCSNYAQASNEAAIWWNLPSWQRSLFMPIVAAGEHDGRGWVVKPWYDNLETVDSGYDDDEGEYFTPLRPDLHELLGVVANQYGLQTDWCARQWKMVGNLPVIHDYGCSTAFGGRWQERAHSEFLPPDWQESFS